MTFNIRNTQYGTGPSKQKAPGNNLYRKANARIRRDQAWESLEQVQRQDSVTLMHDNFYLEKRRVRKWSRSIVNLWQASVREPSLLSPHHLDTLGTEPAFQSQCPKTPTGKRPSGKQPYLLTRGRGGGGRGVFPTSLFHCLSTLRSSLFCAQPARNCTYSKRGSSPGLPEDTGIQNTLSDFDFRSICFTPESQPLAQP